MKRFLGRCLSVALLGATMLGMSQVAKAELVVNGSFEAPDIPGPTQPVSPPNILPGWTTPAPGVGLVQQFTTLGIYFGAKDGQQWLDMSANSPERLGTLSQTLNTVAGQLYKLTFWVGAATQNFGQSSVALKISDTAPVLPDTILAGNYINNNPMATLSGVLQYNWKEFTEFFVADSTSTTIQFTNNGPLSNFAVGLDSVSVTAVPELSTMASWGIMVGIGGIFATRFNRKRLHVQLA